MSEENKLSGICTVNYEALDAICTYVANDKVGSILVKTLNANIVHHLSQDELDNLNSYIEKKIAKEEGKKKDPEKKQEKGKTGKNK